MIWLRQAEHSSLSLSGLTVQHIKQLPKASKYQPWQIKPEVSYRQQSARQLRTQYTEGIYMYKYLHHDLEI